MKIPLFKIYADSKDAKAVVEVIKSGMNWAIGPKIEEFESAVAKYVGVRYALAFNSGTSAMHALMLAFSFKPGDEIIVPSFSFIATANAPFFVGAKPVFAEIESNTFGLDPEDVEKKITKKTKAIMPVHYGGNCCRIEEIRKIAKKHKLILIEDAAEALGAKVKNKKAGSFGDAAIFSLCAPKIITTGEGGIAVTNDRRIYEKLKLIRSHGRLEAANYFESSLPMDYIQLGFNFRISNISAALGISQLAKIEKIIKMRQKNARYLFKKLADLDNIILPQPLSGNYHIFQMFTIIVKGGKNDRDSLKKHLNGRGIMAKIYFDPIHLSHFYRASGYKKGNLPKTEEISAQVLTLPMYPGLSKKEIDFMASEIKKFF